MQNLVNCSTCDFVAYFMILWDFGPKPVVRNDFIHYGTK